MLKDFESMPDSKNGSSIGLRLVSHQIRDSDLILDQLNLTITEGEFISILGPSGCGKSTFLRLLAALEHPTSGEIQFSSSSGRIVRGFVFQEPRLLPWRTVLENIELPLELQGAEPRLFRQDAVHALNRVGLNESIGKYPAQLSGGMKMRVSVARALVFRPNLLLLDEPFSSLDEYTRQVLQEDLRNLWETTKLTVVFVTHSISEAVYLSNRVIFFTQRPAKIALDQLIDLPLERPSEIRLDHRFSLEMKKLSSFLETSKAVLAAPLSVKQ